ncbi:MAG: Nif3-like dinuclear metal center hexameric protein [Desulfovibrio sp. MES5]|uniref:Nif3-like dinuclear metal center hexameric protein n=1 Tax=Desulfovibrio sp. MES5 TaxID=1899016 RepID=UPI000B9C85A1|nr:Nif3-like dinuclear metal center hexameric protein [Desulfovibrio sp. MES5]OXS28653.1 MAG: Nif3-like dinuclear metal center hexameric protein [Desulfovibrio sp. MES5]
MQVAELINTIEEIAPLEAAAPWDISGLQVAALRHEVSSIAVCLDPTPHSIRQSFDLGAQFILSHHPLTLKPSLPTKLDAYHEVLRLLLRADVPLYAAHTSLDVNPRGPAGWLATDLKLDNLTVLEPVSPPDADGHILGYGLAGDLPHPQTVEHIIRALESILDLSTATLSGPPPGKIHRLAYCTGSGSSLLAAAHKAGAQLFITGDVKYHTALDAEIPLLDVGHHSLEEEMMRRMCHVLQQRAHGVAVHFVPSASPFRTVALS